MDFVSGAKGKPRRSGRRGSGRRGVTGPSGGAGRQRINFSRGARDESRGWPRGTGCAGFETREG